MNWHFQVPAIVARKITMSADIQQLWKSAVWTVKQGQDKFLAAYMATVDEQMPGWRDNWKTDPHFAKKLADIEDCVKVICRGNGMPLTTFTRYRTAARKALLMGTPFKFAAQNFTVEEARAIAEGGDEIAKDIRAGKNLRHAATVVGKHATILPLPSEGENPNDYLEILSSRLSDHLKVVRERLGADIHGKLVQYINETANGCQENLGKLTSQRQIQPKKRRTCNEMVSSLPRM